MPPQGSCCRYALLWCFGAAEGGDTPSVLGDAFVRDQVGIIIPKASGRQHAGQSSKLRKGMVVDILLRRRRQRDGFGALEPICSSSQWSRTPADA